MEMHTASLAADILLRIYSNPHTLSSVLLETSAVETLHTTYEVVMNRRFCTASRNLANLSEDQDADVDVQNTSCVVSSTNLVKPYLI